MDYRTLGKDLKVSAVGMGCMGLSRSYGERPDRKYSVDLIAQAVDMGYTFLIRHRSMARKMRRTTTKNSWAKH